MVLTRSQQKELEDSHPHPQSGSQRQESSSSSVVALSSKAAEQPQYGRGCRERRQTQFFEEEVLRREQNRRKGRRNGNQSDSDDDDNEPQRARRYPEREAGKRAVESLRLNMILDEEDEESDRDDAIRASQSARSAKAAKEAALRTSARRGPSVESSAVASDSTDDESDDDAASDSSEGIVSDGDAAQARKSVKKDTPLYRVVDQIVKSTDSKQRPNRKRNRIAADADAPSSSRRGCGTDAGEVGNGAAPPPPSLETLGDITPLPIDTSITFQSVGGLPQHIVALRETIMLPLLYPKLLQDLGVRPPRGLLFTGPPGTGKTLMARAVANECQLTTQKKVSFFMRKGADILSKWVGESEKQLNLLFEAARRHQPSIIFFDEIDGLAPVRHSKQEQTHAALVSTLLALMDGLDDRGHVIVIGATNRPDTLDPALRRPGRFDRELRFTVPDEAARRHIIRIHTETLRVSETRPSERECIETAMLKLSEGWTGADIQACVTEASLHALRNRLPQIFATSNRLKIPSEKVTQVFVTEDDVRAAALRLAPSMQRSDAARVGGMGAVPLINDHMALLLASHIQTACCALEAGWHPCAEAAHIARTANTADMHDAVAAINTMSIPAVQRGFVQIIASDDPSGFGSREVSKGIAKRLSSFAVTHVMVPRLMSTGVVTSHVANRTSGPEAYASSPNGGDESTSSSRGLQSIAELMSSLRASSPSVLFLHDWGTWLDTVAARPNEESAGGLMLTTSESESDILVSLQYELLSALQSSNVLVVIPVASRHLEVLQTHVFGTAWRRMQQLRLAGKPCVVPARPGEVELWKWTQFLWQCAEDNALLAQRKAALKAEAAQEAESFPIDDSPPPPPSPRSKQQAREERLALWKRVEYKRRQLRHLLAQWLSQFIVNRRFQVLLSADLDFTESHALWHDWQRHIRGKRIGLQDIMEKLENEEYTCLSQYVTDIEQLCSNVRTFFTTRSIQDQRYRHRAMELKETTVLNMYKIHKNVTTFCEEHKGMCEPLSGDENDDDESDEEDAVSANNDAVHSKQASIAAVKPKPKRKGWRGERRRRRTQRPTSHGTSPTEPRQSSAVAESPELRASDGLRDDAGRQRSSAEGSTPMSHTTTSASTSSSSSSSTAASAASASSSSVSSTSLLVPCTAGEGDEATHSRLGERSADVDVAVRLTFPPHDDHNEGKGMPTVDWYLSTCSGMCRAFSWEECDAISCIILRGLQESHDQRRADSIGRSVDHAASPSTSHTWQRHMYALWTSATHLIAGET